MDVGRRARTALGGVCDERVLEDMICAATGEVDGKETLLRELEWTRRPDCASTRVS